MATMGTYRAETFEAGEDLSAKQYHFVTLESDGQVDYADADAEACIGVLLNDPSAAGYAATVAIEGRVKVYAGGTVTAGDDVVTNNVGRAIERTASSSATAVTMGKAVTSGTSGGLITIELFQGGKITDES